MFRTTLAIAGLRIAFRVNGPFDIARFRFRFSPYEVPGDGAPYRLMLWIDRAAKRLGAADVPYPAMKAFPSAAGTKLVRSDLSLFLANDGSAEAYARGPSRVPALGFDEDAGEADTPLRVLCTHALLRNGAGAFAHACGLALEGVGGVLVIGRSGAGKTTTARLFSGPEVLSDDQVAVLRRPSGAAIAATPFVGMYGRTIAPCEAPLRAIIVLDRARPGQLVAIDRLHARSALLACLPVYDRSPESARSALAVSDKLMGSVPFFVGAPELEKGAGGFRALLTNALSGVRA